MHALISLQNNRLSPVTLVCARSPPRPPRASQQHAATAGEVTHVNQQSPPLFTLLGTTFTEHHLCIVHEDQHTEGAAAAGDQEGTKQKSEGGRVI